MALAPAIGTAGVARYIGLRVVPAMKLLVNHADQRAQKESPSDCCEAGLRGSVKCGDGVGVLRSILLYRPDFRCCLVSSYFFDA